MVWYRKPGFSRGFGRVVRQAFDGIPDFLDRAPVNPPDEEEDWFLASHTLTPIYESGSDTSDVFVGAVYIDTAVDLIARAYLGTTKTGTNVIVKVRDSYSTSASPVATITTSTVLGNKTQDSASYFSVAAGNWLFFYITCASAECSWQCPAITLTRQ